MKLYQGPRGGFYYKKGGKKIYIGKGIGQSKSISIDEKIPKSIQDLFDEEERLEKEELKKKEQSKKKKSSRAASPPIPLPGILFEHSKFGFESLKPIIFDLEPINDEINNTKILNIPNYFKPLQTIWVYDPWNFPYYVFQGSVPLNYKTKISTFFDFAFKQYRINKKEYNRIIINNPTLKNILN